MNFFLTWPSIRLIHILCNTGVSCKLKCCKAFNSQQQLREILRRFSLMLFVVLIIIFMCLESSCYCTSLYIIFCLQCFTNELPLLDPLPFLTIHFDSPFFKPPLNRQKRHGYYSRLKNAEYPKLSRMLFSIPSQFERNQDNPTSSVIESASPSGNSRVNSFPSAWVSLRSNWTMRLFIPPLLTASPNFFIALVHWPFQLPERAGLS